MEHPPQDNGHVPGGPGNEIGNARIQGDIVQARSVTGGIHFHGGQDERQETGTVPRQLPADVSTFVNRTREMGALARLIGPEPGQPSGKERDAPASVVVITGSAGVGKTALALHWAHRIRGRFHGGEIYANLRGYDEGPPVGPATVLDRVLRDLGTRPDRIPGDADGRAAMFRSLVVGRPILIVLDNVADADQVRPLIPGGAGPLLIITSRSDLPGLAVRDGARRVRLDLLPETDAVALLRQVTQTGDRRDTLQDLAELARLCARLPLALRIAAERAVTRPAMELADLIDDLRDDSMLWDALSLGTGPGADGVRTVFAWSYRGLAGDAARMFRALGIHPGADIGLQTAAAAVGIPARAARRSLDVLLGAFLVESPRRGRYQLHDLLRAYALDQARTIDTEEDRAAVLDRILRWYIAAASGASAVLAPGDTIDVNADPPEGAEPPRFADAAAALEWFDTERPNLVAAARASAGADLPTRTWQLAMALSPVHAQHFTFDDWSELSALAVSAAGETTDRRALAAALDNRGKYLLRRRNMAEARAAHEQALAIRRETGDQRGVIASLNALGLVCLWSRELDEATGYFEETAASARRSGDAQWEGLGKMNQAEALLWAGNGTPAREILAPLPALFVGLGDRGYEGNALWLLSWAQRLAGDILAAGAAIDAALRIAEAAGNRMWEGLWLIEAARVRLASGDAVDALRCCQAAAALQRQIGDPGREADALDCAGEAMSAAGNPGEAVAFHIEAARMHQRLGDIWEEAIALAHLADCGAALGDDGAAAGHARQALQLISPFTDDGAARLRRELETRIA